MNQEDGWFWKGCVQHALLDFKSFSCLDQASFASAYLPACFV